MIEVSAPGKMILAGEWSVLQSGNPGIVTAVDRRVHATLEESEDIRVSADDFKIRRVVGDFRENRLQWLSELTADREEKLLFMKSAVEAALHYLGEFRPFALRTRGELSRTDENDQARKVGFGSSAAAVVSCVAGILAFHGNEITNRRGRDLVFKISAVAHYLAQGKVGSGFDVAASTYGGVFVYRRFDHRWLLEQLTSGRPLSEIVTMKWPGLDVEELAPPDGLDFIVAWTGRSASTSAMVKAMDEWARGDPEERNRIYGSISALVRELVDAWKKNDGEAILSLTRKNEVYLRQLGNLSGIDIETPDLKRLCEIADQNGGAGKLSGAGGGDCGFALTLDPAVSRRIREEWIRNGLRPLAVKMATKGVGMSAPPLSPGLS